MNLQNLIVSPQHNRPVVGFTQEALTNAYAMTSPRVILSRSEFQAIALATYPDLETSDLTDRIDNLLERVHRSRHKLRNDDGSTHHQHLIDNAVLTELTDLYDTNSPSSDRLRYERQARSYLESINTASSFADPTPEVLRATVETLVRRSVEDRHYLTGREAFSLIYPPDYFYSRKTEADPLQPVVKVEEGIQVAGQHTKATLGATHGSMVGDLFKLYGPESAEDLITRGKWLTDRWARSKGNSLTLDTCQTLDPNFSALLSSRIRQAKIDVYRLGPRSNNVLEEARRQELITETLRNVKNTAGKCAMTSIAQYNPNNSLSVMANSGSKGNKENISSIMTLVGQQDYQGQRIPLLPRGQSVPSFERNSRDPASRGFVEHSYYQGLTPVEFYMHQYSARTGLLGTAVKTAETGYMQRRMMKTLEDATVYPDNTVRNAQGVVIQYAYGDDGFAGNQLVMSNNRARFIDPKRLLNLIQSRRRNGLAPFFAPSAPASAVLPRQGFAMPSFARSRGRLFNPDDEFNEPDEEAPDEGGDDASDLEEADEVDDD